MNKYFITTAQANAKPNISFYSSIDEYINNKESELIILNSIGHSAVSSQDDKIENFHPIIQSLGIEYTDRLLNNNIGIWHANVRPYQIDPITGLQRFPQRERTLIIPATKQRWRHIPNMNTKLPRAIIATGSITEPNYATGRDVSAERRRLGNIARKDHEYGGIIVEIINSKKFYWRNILAQTNGKFVDQGMMYGNGSPYKVQPEAMVCGDWHTGYTDKRVRKATLEMIAEREPKRVILHDFFNGHSVSHHYQKELIYQMIREGADKNHLSLEKELYQANKELWKVAEATGNGIVYLVPSNHHEFLNRYLDEGRFVKDAQNARIALKLAVKYADGKNPLRVGMEMIGPMPDNVKWLNWREVLQVCGYNLNNHGHYSSNFGRGNIQTKERDFGASVFGHTHASEKLRRTFGVGTMLPRDTFYLKGNPVPWTHSHALIYSTGVQMENIVNGRYSS